MSESGETSVASRLFVTVIAALTFVSLQLIPLPGIEVKDEYLTGIKPYSWNLSVGCLASAPITSAFVTVEIAALCVPAWRKLRNRDPLGRSKLQRAATICTVVFAAFQAWGVATWLRDSDLFLVDASMQLLTLTITAAVAVSLLLARWIDARGLGVGLSVIIASDLLASAVFQVVEGHPEIRHRYFLALLSVGLFGAAIAYFNRGISAGILKLTPLPKQTDAPADRLDPLRWPLCGVYPVTLTFSIARFPGTLSNFGVSGMDSLENFLIWPGTALLLCAVIAVIFSRLFHPSGRLLDLAHALGIGKQYETRLQGLRYARVLSVALVMALVATSLWFRQHELFLPVLLPVVVAAVLVDLAQEWTFRNRAGALAVVQQFNHVYEADLYADALRQGGIEVYIQGMAHRSLLHFFGPFTQLSLMVPEEQSAKALEIVRGGVGA
jgi:preprotein translocase subunit SecY